MSVGIKNCCRLLALSLVIFTWSGQALAADYEMRGLNLYFIDDAGQKKLVQDTYATESNFDNGGSVFWAIIDPEEVEAHKGMEEGLYFFGADGKLISTLKIPGASACGAEFCPDGKKFILDCGTYVDRRYDLYEFDGLKKKKSLRGWAGLVWLDPHRFVFSLIDDSPDRAKNSDVSGWRSVVVYDSGLDTLEIVAQATATEDFIFETVDSESEQLLINRNYVKTEKDWADEEQIQIENIKIDIPAAG